MIHMKKYLINRKCEYDGVPFTIHADSDIEYGIKLANKINAIKSGDYLVANSTMTLNQWAKQCIPDYKPKQKASTRKKYENHYKNCVGQFIGTYKLRDIKQMHCQRVLNKRADKSQYEINQAYQIMNFLFTHAVENQLIIRNPMIGTVKPTGSKTSRRALTDMERQAAESIFNKTDKYRLFELMLYCGCRPDEAAECKGMDIIDINGYNFLHIRGTKTAKANRKVPIPYDLYGRINDTDPWAYIAANISGKKRSETSRRRLWESFKYDMNKELGAREISKEKLCKDKKKRTFRQLVGILPLADDLVPYCFRHTYCTDLLKKGLDVRTAQALMGHADIKMTARYTHVDDDILITAAEIISPKKCTDVQEKAQG